jgi:hypothetical protein
MASLAGNVLARLAQAKGLCYIDLYPDFVDAAGQLAAPLTDDGLHLSVTGYQRWLAAITPYLSPGYDISSRWRWWTQEPSSMAKSMTRCDSLNTRAALLENMR